MLSWTQLKNWRHIGTLCSWRQSTKEAAPKGTLGVLRSKPALPSEMSGFGLPADGSGREWSPRLCQSVRGWRWWHGWSFMIFITLHKYLYRVAACIIFELYIGVKVAICTIFRWVTGIPGGDYLLVQYKNIINIPRIYWTSTKLSIYKRNLCEFSAIVLSI